MRKTLGQEVSAAQFVAVQDQPPLPGRNAWLHASQRTAERAAGERSRLIPSFVVPMLPSRLRKNCVETLKDDHSACKDVRENFSFAPSGLAVFPFFPTACAVGFIVAGFAAKSLGPHSTLRCAERARIHTLKAALIPCALRGPEGGGALPQKREPPFQQPARPVTLRAARRFYRFCPPTSQGLSRYFILLEGIAPRRSLI